MKAHLQSLLWLALLSACSAASGKALNEPVTDTLPGNIVRVENTGPTEWADTSGWKLVLDQTIQPPEGYQVTPGLQL